MAFYKLKDTDFLESMKNPKRPNQMGQDQQHAILFVYHWIMPELELGNTYLHISKALVMDTLKVTSHQADKAMRRLRKDFLIIHKRQSSHGAPAVYVVNEKYLEVGDVTQGDLQRMWYAQDKNDVKFISCILWCSVNSRRRTASNILIAAELFNAGKIKKVIL